MIPSTFEDVNATFGKDTPGWLGKMDSEVKMITRWRPVRAEVEAMADGASAWLHVFDKEMPKVAIGCADPFLPVHETSAADIGAVSLIDPNNPLRVSETLSAMGQIRYILKMDEQAHPEAVAEKVAMLAHSYIKFRDAP